MLVGDAGVSYMRYMILIVPWYVGRLHEFFSGKRETIKYGTILNFLTDIQLYEFETYTVYYLSLYLYCYIEAIFVVGTIVTLEIFFSILGVRLMLTKGTSGAALIISLESGGVSDSISITAIIIALTVSHVPPAYMSLEYKGREFFQLEGVIFFIYKIIG